TVELHDAAGNVVTGDNTTSVTFAKTSGTGSVSGLGTATTSGGVAYENVTGTLAGSITISASATSLNSGSTTFSVVPGAADRLAFTSANAPLLPGTTRMLTVQLRDAAGNLVTGDDSTSVTFAKTAGVGTMTGIASATASGGIASNQVTGALAGSI